MLIPNRSYSSPAYRYGFQGQEKDDEIKGEGNSLNYTFRMHDPRVGRFFAVDPLAPKYPFYSPYQFSGNRPIDMVELEGLEPGTPGSEEGEMKEARVTNNGKEFGRWGKRRKHEWYWHKGTDFTEEGWYRKDDYELTQLDYEHGQVLPEAKWYEFGDRHINDKGQEAGSGEFYAVVNQEGYLTGETGRKPIYDESLSWFSPVKGPTAVKSIATASKLNNLYFRTKGLAYAYLKRIRLNLPRNASPLKQWTVTDDILKKGWDKATGFVYTSKATHVGKFQMFKTENGYRVIVKHVKDGDIHYHIGKAAHNGKDILFKNADEAAEWFQNNPYTRVDEIKHFYITPTK